MDDNTIFFQITVLDNQDPMMLGRIRARLLTDDYNAIINSITDPPWNEKVDIWTQRDPFVFNPLMPYFMYQVPKVGEMAFTVFTKVSTSDASTSMSKTSISANILNNNPLPSITGLEASGPMSPRPKTAVPLDITATRFPLAVYL